MNNKILIIILYLVCNYHATSQNLNGANSQKRSNVSVSQQTFYTCAKHPQIHESKPGNCPICGMALVKEKSKNPKKAVVKKTITTKKVISETKKEIPQTKEEITDLPKKKSVNETKIKPKTISKTVRYDLYVRDTTVTIGNKPKRAISVNGQIPMPTLTFTEGDIAEIYVHNELKESTSLHWHGLMLPNKEDGVPYLTQMPIEPGTTHKYSFPIIQNGTHWYHSHSGLQEQIGMYGSMILNKKTEDVKFREGIDDLPTIPIILSEWSDVNPNNIHRMLHNATDWFAIQKGTTQSYAEAIKQGHFKTKVINEWKRMNAMDVSDIYYEKFLINGKNEISINPFQSSSPLGRLGGAKVRLRISNGGASSYFWLTYAGGKITVVASDGNDVEPVAVDRLLIAVSETYDVIVEIPDDKTSYEFLATSEDRTKSASLYIGEGIKKLTAPLPKLKYFEGMKMMNDMMKMNGDLDDMGMSMSYNQMDMNVVMYPEASPDPSEGGEQKEPIVTLNYAMLKSPFKTNLPTPPLGAGGIKELRFELSGNMNRYVWSLDNKVVSETDKILIKKGENVRITLYNGSMMRHPMHLHGHDFRVLNGQEDYSPLKNIIDIMPTETDVIEFNANAEGDWFFHCHILYHMMAGMGRVFTYENQAPNPLIPNPKLAQRKLFGEDRKFHFMGENDLATNGNDGMIMFGSTRWSIGTEWRLGYNDHHGYETETHIGRYLGKMQWLMPFVGFDWRYRKMDGEAEKNLFNQSNTKDNRAVFSAGLEYTMPMLIKAQAEVFTDGNFRLQFERMDIPVSKRLRMNLMWNTDKEYMAGLRYIIKRNFGVTTHYDSDMGIGFGASLNY